MKIQRDLIDSLKGWKNALERKPILLKGARQTGKTWIMEEFGKQCFDYVAEFNFDKTTELASIFEKTKDIQRILKELTLFTNVPIEPGKTLIIFDEIQACEGALNSLKYFCEDAPQYHLIAAGSLLGVAIRKKKMSVPVGKVQILQTYPVTFKEFLRASDLQTYSYVHNLSQIELLPEIILHKLEVEYRRYLVCGGMPESVTALLGNEGMQRVEDVLQNILDLYTLDFAKYATPTDIPRINNLWNSLPSQLAKENRKFIYKVIKTGARAREYEDALLWLEEAGLIYRVYNVSKPGIPLSAYQDLSAFKVYAFDCGILRRLAKLSPEVILSGNAGYVEFKGALAENAILQALVPQSDGLPYYWSSENRAEVDFILQQGFHVIPVEVKAENRISGKSLSVYTSKFGPQLKIRYSLNNLKMNEGLLCLPSFLADWTYQISGWIK
ncbi:MAG TPA: AAA family ATPase [Bacteroidales bacterium]|nr:AAA family ATPase [Bacteroidales bacterium]